MKYLLAVAAIIAVVTAGPTQRGMVIPEAGPAPVPEFVEPNPGPTFVDNYVPIDFGPVSAPEQLEPNPGPTFVDNFVPIDFGPVLAPQLLEPNPGPTFVDNLVPDFGPVPVPELMTPGTGPTFINKLTPGFGPTPADPIAPIAKPTPVKPEVIEIPVAGDVMPIIQIVVNINGVGAEINPIGPVAPVFPSPIIVDEAPVSPVQVVETAPISIGNPELPTPIVSQPDELN